jgi:uncharacterized protein (TIGR00299 family) protein
MGISGRRVIVKDLQKKSGHPHRTYAEIEKIINKSRMNKRVKEKSIDIFYRIANAEAKIHSQKISEVHFHEVGAIDSIVDIVGSAAGIDFLGVEESISSAVPLGSGFVKCQHGTIPIPAPATLEILKGVPVYSSGVKSELVTPTGAAILTSFAKEFKPMPQIKIIKTGFGAGSRVYEAIPNLLRLILGDMEKGSAQDKVWVLETNVDDMNSEWTGFLMDRLFEAGALDVFLVPVYMKKNRPGVMIKVICDDKKREELSGIVFRESTTAGVRSYVVERDILKRREGKLKTKFGVLKVKILGEAKSKRIVPEFEECKKVALKKKIPLKKVYEEIYAAVKKTG